MNLKHVALAGAAIAAAIGGSGGLANAENGDRGGWRTVRVEFTPTAFVISNVAEVCVPGPCVDDPSVEQRSVQVLTATATQTGDLVGSTAQASTLGSNGVDPTVTPQNVTGTFDGVVKRCGSRSFLYSGRGNLDLTTFVSTMTYTIVEGSGTGELAGISGQLRQSGPYGAEVPITGTVRCRRS